MPRSLAGPLATASLILLLSPAGAVAQKLGEADPIDSPYWWTLSPDLSPAALRERLLDPADHQKHYLLSVEQKRQDPISDERLAQLAYFVDGGLTPEHFRAAEVFEMLTLRFKYRPWWVETVDDTLESYGLDAAARETILKVVRESLKERMAFEERVEPLKKEYLDVRSAVEEQLGEAAGSRALASRDVRLLAQASGRSEQEIRKLADAWDEDAHEIAIASLVALKRLLSERDWNAFRDFLREEVARDMSTTSFHDVEGNDQ